jgi:hemolysin activation/secretion protein
MLTFQYKAGFTVGIFLTSLTAAPFTDTGSIYNQVKKNAERGLETRKHPKKKKKQQAIYSKKYMVHVNGFKVVGNDELSQAEIDKVLSPFIGRDMSTEELIETANALTEYYQKKGFFTASVALIEPYVLAGGIIVLVVDERHLEKEGISVENNGTRIKTEKVLTLWNNIMKPGAIKQEEFERAMLLTNDLPGISAKADLYYGTEENTDDLVVTLTDEDLFNANMDIDNYGSYYTGRTQVATTLYWNSPTGNGEEIVVRLITTGKYSNYGYIDFAVPVLDNGMRLGTSFDYLDYELKHQKPGEDGDGTAWNATVYAKYPVIRTEKFNIEVELDYVHTKLKDYSLSQEVDNSDIDKGVFRVSMNRSDEFMQNGITYLDFAVITGNLKLNNAQNKQRDDMYFRTEGQFTKATFSLSRYQNIAGNLSSKISIDGQWASKNLDSSEKYFIGGPYSLAGYATGEFAGDNAAVFYADLRYDFYNMPWSGDLQLSAFYSYGWLQIFKDGSTRDRIKDMYYPLDPIENELNLQTIGLGLSQTWSDTAVIRLTVGKQIGGDKHIKRPYNDPSGLDYDHSDSDYRVWVEGIYYW